MQPQGEGYDEPEPTGHPDSARLFTASVSQLIGFPGVNAGSKIGRENQ